MRVEVAREIPKTLQDKFKEASRLYDEAQDDLSREILQNMPRR